MIGSHCLTPWIVAGALALLLPLPAVAEAPAPNQPEGQASKQSAHPSESPDNASLVASSDEPELWQGCWVSSLSLTNAMTCMLLNIDADRDPISTRMDGREDPRRKEKIATAKETLACFSTCRDENLSATNQATCSLQCTASLRSRTMDRLAQLRMITIPSEPDGDEVAVADTTDAERNAQ